ncbi:bromodomain adjacent to zinc finger domain protein 1A isoform X2 [Bacillus rossius redtenbacheri]|uniref:bromodomain adjacent to zinc finger domain protein 1A isoform X2 n=1 Tax=Bacillus rossius redtenbacheri TaxID=93214 RepID=UPI002FDD76F9
MPLLRGKPFEVLQPTNDFKDDEELFPCEMTDEVFRTYEELCERIILCNSVDWSCAVTGKSGLTYLEALESEESAARSLEDVPRQLRVPLLYLTSFTQRTSFLDLAEDIFSYVRDRYFIGEYVEVCLKNELWFDCCITRVIPPSSLRQSIIHSPARIEYNRNMAALFRYEVRKLGRGSDDVSEIFEVGSTNVKRKKNQYTRDKSKMFLKLQTTQDENGMWIVKDEVVQKYNLHKVKFSDIFGGPLPMFECSRKIQKLQPNGAVPTKHANGSFKKEKRQEKIDKYFSPNKEMKGAVSPAKQHGSGSKMSPRKYSQDGLVLSPQSKLAKKLKSKYINNSLKGSVKKNLLQNHQLKKHTSPHKTAESMLLDAKHRQQEKRRLLRQEKSKLANFMKEWNREREDLECDDLKELPLPSIINCGIPDEHFGDVIMILEFFNSFKNELPAKKYFPYGQVTFDLVKRALLAKEVAGPLCDILELLLTTLFEMQSDEEKKIHDADTLKTTADLDIDDLGDVTMAEAIKAATAAVKWSQLYQGTPLSRLTLDAVTISEVLRLHLLSSGGRSEEQRYQQQGGYTLLDDPGLQLRIQHPHILRALSVSTVAELPIGDKLKVLTCLISQLLTYDVFMDVIDERTENVKKLKLELKTSQATEMKQHKEAIALRMKKRKESKQQLLTKGGDLNDPKAGQDKVKYELDEAKEAKDWERKNQEWDKKALEIEELKTGFQLLPLGVDRAYRRYWLFPSLSGLFVENEEVFPGVCLSKPTQCNPSLVGGDDSALYIKHLFEEERSGNSDKENDSFNGPVLSSTSRSVVLTPSKKLNALSQTNAKVMSPPDSKPDLVIEQRKVVPQTLACTANINTCPIHGTNVPRTRWAFFSEEEEVHSLIKCLNKRGFREGKLRRALIFQQERILQNLKSCPISKLDESRVLEERKSSRIPQPKYDDANLSFPADMPVEDVMENTLIDCIMQLEEKIESGGLGFLKVHNRGAWQEALTKRSYSQQCERLIWGKGSHKGENRVKIPVSKLKMEGSESRPNTPSSEDGVRLLNHQYSVSQRPVVKNLASALLQVAQAMDPKYLQKPLAPDEVNDNYDWSAMERWESSLMACTSLAQVFLHLSTLDNSIQWRRSAMNAFCRLCRGRKDAENMLLCDGCNRGHHLYCLKPKLTRVPQGDWFCDKCRPKEKERSSKKVKKPFSEEYAEDNDTTETRHSAAVCDSCGCGGRLLACVNCSHTLHFTCITPSLKKMPKIWKCDRCQNKAHRSRKRKADDSSVKEDEVKKDEDELLPSRRSHRRSHALDESLPLDNAVLQDFLTELIHHKDAWPFLKPVLKAQAPDYHLIIKNPMDFGKMKNKLNMLQYTNNSEFVLDAILVFDNCYTYNDDTAEEYKAGKRLSRFFFKRCQQLGLKIPDDAQPSDAKRTRAST